MNKKIIIRESLVYILFFQFLSNSMMDNKKVYLKSFLNKGINFFNSNEGLTTVTFTFSYFMIKILKKR